MSDTERKYPITYQAKIEQHTAAELRAEGLGGTDAIVIVSILRKYLDKPHEGSKSFAIITMDGHTGEKIPSTELFQVFAHLAHLLSEDVDVLDWQADIARAALSAVRSVICK